MITSSRLRVAVVGCGIGGPAAALFLQRAGHEVVIFEQSPELGQAGAGILIAPTGQYVLEHLGLLESVLDHGSRVQRLEGHTLGGRKILDLRYRHYGTGLFGLGIHRGALFSILRDALVDERVSVVTGHHARSVEDDRILFEDGTSDGPFDLIVVADGSRSSLRRSMGLESHCTEYPYGALWVSATNWGELPDNVLRQTYQGTRRMAGLLPSGRLPGSTGRQMSLFWSIPLSAVDDWRSRGLDAWKAEVVRFVPESSQLLDQIDHPEQVTIAGYQDLATWTPIKDRCILLGDAAHATSPQLGQGASLALFDAYVLAQCIARERTLTPALLTYRDLRARHTRFYQMASKWMTPFFQSGHEYLSWPRDLLMGPIGRIPWVQRQMTGTMVGVQQGLLQVIHQEPEILKMGARFAFGKLVQTEREPTAVVRW